jgi:pilus assembly protein CpaC
LAEDYAPKVINNISVGGVQQILLKVRVFEVSRTKLRKLGVDWAYVGGSGDFAVSSVSGLISSFDSAAGSFEILNDTFAFGIVDGASSFFGVLDALQECKVAKILAEPNLVAVSGRPAQFNVGGEFPIVVPQSLGTASIEFKKFGTQVDFLPIVLGNGNIRLEVRPRISERDFANGVQLPGAESIVVPALTVREVDTAVEMKAGQTFALAGLVQERTEAVNRGLPFLSDIPVLGVPFRQTRNEINEIELLIMVTPEFVDPIESGELPCGGPGYATTSPTNCDLYCAGHVEVPVQYNPISGMTACGECGGGPCGAPYCQGCQNCNGGAVMTEGAVLPGGVGYDEVSGGSSQTIQPVRSMVLQADELGHPKEPTKGTVEPSIHAPIQLQPQGMTLPASSGPADDAGANRSTGVRRGSRLQGTSSSTAPRTHSPPREPTYVRNTSSPDNRYGEQQQEEAPLDIATGLIGPVGYDP